MTADQLEHRPNCGPDEETVTTVGHSVTITRCMHCGAITTERHRADHPEENR